MQILPISILLRHHSGREMTGNRLCAAKWIIQRMLSTKLGAGGGKEQMAPVQQPLLLEPQVGNDKGILLAKMNIPRTKNALSRALVEQVHLNIRENIAFFS